MNDHEREAAQRGQQVLDRALVALGHRPVAENPDFRVTEPVVLDFPTTVLERQGVAPMRFMFGPHLDVWVGPFAELLMLEMSDPEEGDAQSRVERLLRSSVACRAGAWSTEIRFQVPGDEPWLRRKNLGLRQALDLEPSYGPYSA